MAIARALANDPPVILADEPCASLDAHTAREVLSEFWAVCRQDGKTVLVVSHEDAALAAAHRGPGHVRDQPRRWSAPGGVSG